MRYGAAPFYKPIPTRPSRNHAGRGRFSSALLMALGAESDDGAADADALARLARHEDGVARARGRMPSAARRLREAEAGRHEKTGLRGGPSAGPTCPFMFVEYVDIGAMRGSNTRLSPGSSLSTRVWAGPLVVRRDAFVSVGGFSSMFSCLGDPGIGLDEELSMQFWLRGYQVGLLSSLPPHLLAPSPPHLPTGYDGYPQPRPQP